MYIMQEFAACFGVVLLMATLLLIVSGIGYALKSSGSVFLRSVRTGACHDAFASLATRLKSGPSVSVEVLPVADPRLPQ